MLLIAESECCMDVLVQDLTTVGSKLAETACMLADSDFFLALVIEDATYVLSTGFTFVLATFF
jgi:hypothetical protein